MMYLSLYYYFLIALLIPILPYLIYQAKSIRRAVPELSEAVGITGATSMLVESRKKLLFIGESTIAGVGVQDQKEGIAGKVCEHLHQETGEHYQWQVLAKSGYRTRDIIKYILKNLPSQCPDLIVIGMGGNDTFQLTSPVRFSQEMHTIIQRLQAKYPDIRIIIGGLPPVRLFPAFAGLTARILGTFVKLHARSMMPLHQPGLGIYVMPSLLTKNDWTEISDEKIENLFSDGVHPSGYTYALWAKTISQYISERKILS